MLREQIRLQEGQMRAQLDRSRERFSHRGGRGANAESVFRHFLAEYLPHRMALGHGEVVDTHGHRSRETDVVLLSEEHPPLFSPDLHGLFYVEGVSAAAEVKSVLDSKGLADALEKGKVFKRLQLHVPQGALFCTSPSDEARFYRCPPFFLFAFESRLTLETIGRRVQEFESAKDADTKTLDAIFVLDRGYLVNCGDGKGGFQIRAGGQSVPGWSVHRRQSVLYDLLAWLSIVMPRMVGGAPIMIPYLVGRVPTGITRRGHSIPDAGRLHVPLLRPDPGPP